jgi:hypothetical protein
MGQGEACGEALRHSTVRGGGRQLQPGNEYHL